MTYEDVVNVYDALDTAAAAAVGLGVRHKMYPRRVTGALVSAGFRIVDLVVLGLILAGSPVAVVALPGKPLVAALTVTRTGLQAELVEVSEWML